MVMRILIRRFLGPLVALAPLATVHAQLEAGIAVGQPAPAVTIPDLQGIPVDLGTVIGKKPVLIEFWATWCSICKGLLPELERVQRAYGEQIVMLGVNVTVNDSKARVARYLEDHHPPFRVLYDEKGIGARAYDAPATSYIVVVNAAGTVAYTGSGEKQDLVGAVKRALATLPGELRNKP
jgi:thiol-disulfide isomerase/thioredoxin